MTVCDREGDSRDLLSRAEETGAALLVRASRGVRRRVALASGGAEDQGSRLRRPEPQEGPHG